MSELPKFHELFGPVLDVLSDGAEHSRRDILVEVSDLLAIPQALREETIPSGMPRLMNRTWWALSYLGQAGCIDRPKRGVFQINSRGRDLRTARPAVITVADLEPYPEFQEFRARSGKRRDTDEPVDDPGSSEALTPTEQIATAVHELETATAQELVERIRQMPPEFLEKAVLQLLVAMGYGGSDADALHLGGPGDGGFDGVINQDRLGLGRIYVQAKRYAADNSVGRPDVQGFVGALHGMGAAGGVFITTSRFTPDAVSFAKGINPRVILIDGARLGELMIQYGVGVQETRTVRLVEVDEDFFE
jgi:restriction system protein